MRLCRENTGIYTMVTLLGVMVLNLVNFILQVHG